MWQRRTENKRHPPAAGLAAGRDVNQGWSRFSLGGPSCWVFAGRRSACGPTPVAVGGSTCRERGRGLVPLTLTTIAATATLQRKLGPIVREGGGTTKACMQYSRISLQTGEFQWNSVISDRIPEPRFKYYSIRNECMCTFSNAMVPRTRKKNSF